MVFSTALRPFLQRRPDALDLLEIEPQTLWLADDAFGGPFFEYSPGIDFFAGLPGHKLVHSVGMPLGGTRRPDPAQMALLRSTAERLDSPWVSEHLSVAGTPHRAAGFLLPPLQTEEGVEIAARNIRDFAKGVGRLVAIETGVAYLRRKPFEMHDGAFVARVAEAADCGILLDLHNIYCNEKNGRIAMDAFLSDIPLDRVWEVHLAGGMEMDGFWLDAHSGEMPDELAERSRQIVRSLPNLGALNFEIYDTFLEKLDQDTFDRIVGQLRSIWEQAGTAAPDAVPARSPEPPPATARRSAEWETNLTEAVWRGKPEKHPWPEDRAPVKLYSGLARSFRGSMLTRGLPRTIRYLLLRDGRDVDAMLRDYFDAVDPKLYTPLEARAFFDWYAERGDTDPLLHALLSYDMAFMQIVRDGKPRVVTFPGNPTPVFEALAEARLPDSPSPPKWEIEILPDGFTVADFAANVAGS
jgi:uncharacterized protein (UPF0276 family)